MQEIRKFLRRETKEFKRKTIKLDSQMKDPKLEEDKKKMKKKFDEWLITLNEFFSNKLYRQVIREIEDKKNNYLLISKTEFWKLKLLKAKSILKIIARKMTKHHKEVILENSIQNFSLKFWFNQIFMSLEELCLEFRFDINSHMDPNSKEILSAIQSLAEAHLEFIYYLSVFSIGTGEVMPLLTYISNADKLIQFSNLLLNPEVYDLYLDILLIKIKILIENCNYIPAIETLGIFFKIFFKDIIFYIDFEVPLTSESINSSNKIEKKKNFNLCNVIQKLIMAYYLRGVISEHLGFYKNAIKAYQQCRWFSNIFMFNFNKPIFKFFRNMEKIYITYNEVFEEIQEQFEKKNKNNKINFDKKGKSHRILYLKKRGLNKSMISMKSKNFFLTNRKIKRNDRYSSGKSIISEKQLVRALNNIGKRLYKEDENRNNNIFDKFGTNDFVLSTIGMVNNLLSTPFREVLRKMKKVEVTKPIEEISYLINKTLAIKRRNEFKEEMEKKSKSKSKKNPHKLHRNKSTFTDMSSVMNKNMNEFEASIKYNIKLVSKKDSNKNENGKDNNRYEVSTSNAVRTKFMLSSIKTNKYKNTNKSTLINYNKVDKYSPDKDVFSKSLTCKKKYLDSFFEKELLFQKKLLKLKSSDMERVTMDDYNPQQIVKSAEQDFNIIKCFAESKNAKKNLMNLVRNNELKNWELMYKNKGRMRTNRRMNLLNLNSLNNFMKIHHINQIRVKYEPDNAAKNNDEKTKLLTLECAKLEEMQNECLMKKEMLRKEILGYKTKKVNI